MRLGVTTFGEVVTEVVTGCDGLRRWWMIPSLTEYERTEVSPEQRLAAAQIDQVIAILRSGGRSMRNDPRPRTALADAHAWLDDTSGGWPHPFVGVCAILVIDPIVTRRRIRQAAAGGGRKQWAPTRKVFGARQNRKRATQIGKMAS